MLTTRADLEALLGAVLWTQRTNPNLTGAMRARLTEIENRLMDGITHCGAAFQQKPTKETKTSFSSLPSVHTS